MASKYAANTEVSTAQSKVEIERILQRYGATAFMFGWSGDQAQIAFQLQGRQYRIQVPLPSKEQFRYTPARRWEREDSDMLRAWEQACRQRWRALALVLKAKLEAVETGISSVDTEFLAYTLLPDRSTVHEWLAPQIQEIYRTGKMPETLPGLDRPALPKPVA